MNRLFACAFLIGFLMQDANAQTFLALQGEVAEPTEDFRQSAGTGYGVKATYMRHLTTRFALTGSAGYVHWSSRSNLPPNNEFKVVAVPMSFGANFLLSRGVVAPYLGMAIGMDYLRIRGIGPNATAYEDKSELHFAFAPHIGVGVHISGPIGVLATGSYNVIYTSPSTSKYFALGLGLAANL